MDDEIVKAIKQERPLPVTANDRVHVCLSEAKTSRGTHGSIFYISYPSSLACLTDITIPFES